VAISAKQAEDEFANFEPPDDPRKFPTLYTVQRLKTNSINPAAKVVIATIQRLYSMLKGEAEFDTDDDEDFRYERLLRRGDRRRPPASDRANRRRHPRARPWRRVERIR